MAINGLSNILSGSLKNQLFAIKRTQDAIAQTQLRLATGLKVNSALDNPQNFFAARNLNNRSGDLQRLLDGIGQNIQVIQAASAGIEAAENILEQAESFVTEAKQTFPEEGILEPGQIRADANTQSLSSLIFNDNPDAYYRLNDGGGTVAANSGFGAGVSDANTQNGVNLDGDDLYTIGASGSADFNGVNQRIRVPDAALINLNQTPRRTVELTFNADDVVSRQILYEEGATVNSLAIYIDNGRVYTVGRDAGAWGPSNISAEIVAGETYHVAFVYDRSGNAGAGSFTGYLNGEEMGSVTTGNINFPSHSGDIGIGAINGGVWFHDGSTGAGNGFFYDGRISDVAIYNTALTQDDFAARYGAIVGEEVEGLDEEYQRIVSQLDQVVLDSSYRGTNLLAGDVLTTFFNEDRTSSLISEGRSLSSAALGVDRRPFIDPEDLDETVRLIQEALITVRNYATSLANDLNIIQTRETLTKSLINTLEEGSDKLTVADQNEEGANILASQVRLALGITALSLAGQSEQSVLRLF